MQSALWYGILLLIPLLFVVYPLINLFVIGFYDAAAGTLTLDYLERALTTPRYLSALWRTLSIASSVTVIAMVIGVLCSIYLWRRDFPGKRMLLNLLIIPYMMPVYIIALGLILLIGKNGLIAVVMRVITGDPAYQFPFAFFFTFHGIISVYIFHNFTLVIFLVMAFLSGINPSYIEAARSLGAPLGTALRRVILPIAMPAISGAAILVFARTMVDYVVIETIGGFRHSTLAVEIYNLNFGFFEPELAAPLAALLSVMTISMMYFYLYIFRWRKGA